MVDHILCSHTEIGSYSRLEGCSKELDRESRLAVWLDINNKANESGISEFDGSIVAVD
jgi:hypothetical protein